MEKTERVIKIVGSLIAIIIPCVLLAGYSYHLGYITTYGLSSDLVPKSMPEMLVESWYVSVMAMAWLLSKWAYFVGIGLGFFLLFVGVFFWMRHIKSKGVTWGFEKITKENQGKTILGVTQWHWVCLGELFGDVFNWVYRPLAILAFISVLTAFPYLDAKNYADQQIEIFQKEGCKTKKETVSCIALVDSTKQHGNVLAEGILVSASENRIAIYSNKLEVWPLLDTYLIEGIVSKTNK